MAQNGLILARKSVFCYRTPDFVNGPFVTLYETVDLAPLERFLNFSFPSYGPKWPKMAIFGNSPIASISTPNFGPISMKLGPVVRFTKKMTLHKLGLRSALFFGQNFRILARKSVFCYRTPDFVNDPFVALAKAVDLAPLDPFFDF